MPGITALEFGARTCAVVRMSGRRHGSRVNAAEVLDQAGFSDSESFANSLRQVRKKLRLPRRARAVVWGVPEGSSGKDPSIAPLIAPLLDAGFRVERVVTPCDALAVLARLRTPRPNAATCWLAIDRDGVAVIAVRPGKLLYSHSFVWDSSFGAIGSQARLLQRYSLVSVLAPEVQRAMAAARADGTPVEGIVTCGNQPDLRSLTMPLIEELDVEVETLDSLEGLAVDQNFAGQIGDAAAAIRIACAAAVARGSRPSWPDRRSTTLGRYALLAAGLAVMFVAGWYVIAHRSRSAPPPRAAVTHRVTPPVRQTNGSSQPAAAAASRAPGTGAVGRSTAGGAAPTPQRPPGTATAPKPANASAGAASGNPVVRRPALPAPPLAASRGTVPPAAPSVSGAPPSIRGVMPVPPLPTPRPVGPGSRTVPTQTPAPRTTVSPPLRGAQSAETPATHVPAAPAAAPSGPRTNPKPLTDPLPRVTGILVSQDRRYATLDTGRVVTVGDVIGPRTVVAIDERAITLREPSGLEVRVALRGRTNSPGKPQRQGAGG